MKQSSRRARNRGDHEYGNFHEELQELQDLAFQPTVHHMYEDELFPELEFSRKYSDVSQSDH